MGGSTYSGFTSRGSTVLGKDEESVIKSAFDNFKDPETGKINCQRLKDLFNDWRSTGENEEMDKKAKAEEDAAIEKLLDDMDTNGDNDIDEDEFKAVMKRKFLGEDADTSFIFGAEMLDEDRDGFIPLVELRYILTNEGSHPMTEQEADELLMFADLDGDGLVDYPAFLRWLASPEVGLARP